MTSVEVLAEAEADLEVVAVGRSGRTAAAQLFTRTVVIRFVALGGTAVLARILSPEDFGTFAVVAFLVGFVGPLADFGLGPALIQQQARPDQRELSTVFSIQLGFAIFLTAVIWLLAPLARFLVPSLPPDIDWMIRFTALILPLIAIRALPAAMMSRVLRFGPLATIEIIQQVVYFSTAVVLALAGLGAWSFVWALLAHTAIGALLCQRAWGQRVGLRLDRDIARRMVTFGVPFQATSMLVTAREALVPLFGGLAGGLAAIGYLNFGFRLGRLAGSVDEIIGRIAFPAFSRLQTDRNRLQTALVWAIESTALMLAVLLGWAVAVAPTLIPFVFSEQWRPSVPVFQLVALGTLVLVPGNFVRGLAFACGRGRQMLVWSVATIAVAAVIFPLMLVAFGVTGGGLAFAIYSTVQLVGYVYATRSIARFPWSRLARIYGLMAVTSVVAAVVNAAIGTVNGMLLIGLVVSGLAYVGLFALLLLVFERDQVRRAWALVRGSAGGSGPTLDQEVDGSPTSA